MAAGQRRRLRQTIMTLEPAMVIGLSVLVLLTAVSWLAKRSKRDD